MRKFDNKKVHPLKGRLVRDKLQLMVPTPNAPSIQQSINASIVKSLNEADERTVEKVNDQEDTE